MITKKPLTIVGNMGYYDGDVKKIKQYCDLVLGEYIGSGKTRAVYNHPTVKDMVIKIPIHEDGEMHSYNEWMKYREGKEDMAYCYYDKHTGVLHMEKMKDIIDKDNGITNGGYEKKYHIDLDKRVMPEWARKISTMIYLG